MLGGTWPDGKIRKGFAPHSCYIKNDIAMKKLWDNITEDDVKKAIELFEKSREKYPQPKNTFLLYKGKRYSELCGIF